MAYNLVPSMKSLLDVFDITKEEAKQILDILHREKKYDEEYKDYRNGGYISEGKYNPYSYNEWAQEKVDTILKTCGIEYIRVKNGEDSFTYCNTGDSYGTTILFKGNHAWIGNWGDIVERGGYE